MVGSNFLVIVILIGGPLTFGSESYEFFKQGKIIKKGSFHGDLPNVAPFCTLLVVYLEVTLNPQDTSVILISHFNRKQGGMI